MELVPARVRDWAEEGAEKPARPPRPLRASRHEVRTIQHMGDGRRRHASEPSYGREAC
jgi:hypothetical protein